jgi:group I intron endonuclease
MSSGIYCILNTSNGHRYIGQSVDLSRRKSYHFTALAKGIHKNRHLQSAWNRYGAQTFKWEVLQVVSHPYLLDAQERYWIDLYATNDHKHGYNTESGGRRDLPLTFRTRCNMILAQQKRRNKEYSIGHEDQRDIRDTQYR